ncbi:hypothetical protein Glove_232g123 [Diversispora epigaea]|uniref:Uncharacterized protein n=1 Tax=Diversispora epigaea TaxID=1348612 RepID=A0A397IEF9_9GLOM|nr:hypothetical protein Glove_232g123 [Diversispora epigaea]
MAILLLKWSLSNVDYCKGKNRNGYTRNTSLIQGNFELLENLEMLDTRLIEGEEFDHAQLGRKNEFDEINDTLNEEENNNNK